MIRIDREASAARIRRDVERVARFTAGLLFVPCRDGVSHSPAEEAEPADAALGVEVLLNALLALGGRP